MHRGIQRLYSSFRVPNIVLSLLDCRLPIICNSVVKPFGIISSQFGYQFRAFSENNEKVDKPKNIEKQMHELDLKNASDRKMFVRKIDCDEDASKEEMIKAFDAYKELAYRDIRISYNELMRLMTNMLNRYEWDHYIYTQMLHILYEYRSTTVAYEVILKMKENSVIINSEDYMDAIRVCSVSGNSDKIATVLWNMMLAEGYLPSLVDYEILMNCFIRSDAISDAETLFENIRLRGFKPTVWTYNTLMNGYKRNGSWERALQMYQIMKLDGINPDGITYTIILDLLFKCKKQEYAHVIVKDIQNGDDLVECITETLTTKYPNSIFNNISLLNSVDFFTNFDSIFSDPTLKDLHFQFSKLLLKKTYINSLLLWYINQDNRLAILYLYKNSLRSKKTLPNDLTYKLLFHYCGVKHDSDFFELIIKNATDQKFTYNVIVH